MGGLLIGARSAVFLVHWACMYARAWGEEQDCGAIGAPRPCALQQLTQHSGAWQAKGYAFQMENIVRARAAGYTVAEVRAHGRTAGTGCCAAATAHCTQLSAVPPVDRPFACAYADVQVPIVFVDRLFGASKLGGAEIKMYLQARAGGAPGPAHEACNEPWPSWAQRAGSGAAVLHNMIPWGEQT